MGHRFLLLLIVLSATLILTTLNYYFFVRGLVGDDAPPLADQDALSLAAGLPDMESRIKEMLRIRGSVAQELRKLEAMREGLVSDVSELREKRDAFKSDLNRLQKEVDRTRSLLQQLELDRRDAAIRQTPLFLRPLKLLPLVVPDAPVVPDARIDGCSMDLCFDYSRCPLTSGCPVYLYTATEVHLLRNLKSRNEILWIDDAATACLFVVILSPDVPLTRIQSQKSWNRGTNHIVFNLNPGLVLNETDVEKGILVQGRFRRRSFREEYDIVSLGGEDVGQEKGLVSPARRKYLVSCATANDTTHAVPAINLLQKLQANTGESFFWNTTFDETILKESTFYLIVDEDGERNLISSPRITTAVIACIRLGAIPVLVTRSKVRLPLHQVIDWDKVVLSVPGPRITELYLILKSFHDKDLLEMRRTGRMLYERYFRDMEAFVVSTIASVRQKRLQIPGPAIAGIVRQSYYSGENPMKTFEVIPPDPEAESSELDEILGPVESPFPSPSFERNLSLVLNWGYDLWNNPALSPFFTYPSTPFDPLIPSESKFIGTEYGFRPIGGGSGGSGKEFSQALGGNEAKEQFTIVMLTYEREAVLLDSLQRLKGMPFLNKVIVVWNNAVRKPDAALMWPNIQVPVTVIVAEKNSLNNRFLPFNEIETDAVLSLDDDAHLRHDEIVFGFRVWREARDRIVGFPGRFHAWDPGHRSWLYNSNYSCELSMVLTGAAFFHKYYAYAYTFHMPPLVRQVVDQFTNCEDIAMNFLVSHMTRKPPIKVTSRWTFSCPGCPVALSESDSHFEERHQCMNIFTEAFGYNPLLNTQFRADSVLFKTRIPRDKQKCFRHV